MNALTHQSTCVAVTGRAILIEGEPGIGKTTLALSLIDRGATLVGDDGVLLECRQGTLWAIPHPNTCGLVEIRNVGIATLPCTEAPVALILTLTDLAPRHIDRVGSRHLHGVDIPCLAFWPSSPIGAYRAEMALAMHGLTP